MGSERSGIWITVVGGASGAGGIGIPVHSGGPGGDVVEVVLECNPGVGAPPVVAVDACRTGV